MKRKLQNVYGDGQQFHKYISKTNNHLSSQLTEHEKTHNIHCMLEIQVLVWDRHKHVAGLNRLMIFQNFPSLLIGSRLYRCLHFYRILHWKTFFFFTHWHYFLNFDHADFMDSIFIKSSV